MNYPLFLARRLSLGSGGKRNAPAVTVAIIATAISVIVMIASIAIVLGFKQEIREKVIGFNGHISLFKIPASEDDDNLITLDNDLKETLDSISFVKSYALQAALPAIMKTNEDFKGVYLKALEGPVTSDYIAKNLEEGELPDFHDEENKTKVIISRIAARQLKLNVGDKIDTYFISDDVRVRRMEVAGIYNTHFDQYDDVLIFGSMSLLSQLGGIDENQGTYLMIATDDFDSIEEYTIHLRNILNNEYLDGRFTNPFNTDNVLRQGRGVFSWLSLLDTNVLVIIILMLVVGSVTLISGMLIIILQRKRFIGLMRALGADKLHIRRIFIYLAFKISAWGLLIGDCIAVVVLLLQKKYHFIPLDAESYYIDFVPVNLTWETVVFINIGVLVVSYLVLVLPSRFVGKISPAETMEDE